MTEAYKKSKYIAIIKVFGIGTLKMKMLNVLDQLANENEFTTMKLKIIQIKMFCVSMKLKCTQIKMF